MRNLTRRDAIAIVISLLVIFIIAGMILPMFSTIRESGHPTKCTNNVRSIAGALENYLSAYGSYPVPAPQFRGDCWLATLYWTDMLSDKRIFICPSTADDSTKLQEPSPSLMKASSPADSARIDYPISQANFAKADTIPTEAISYCGRTNMSGLRVLRTPNEQFTEKGLANLPIVCDAPDNHIGYIYVAYIDQHVEQLQNAAAYVGQPPPKVVSPQDPDLAKKLAALWPMDSGDDAPRTPFATTPPAASAQAAHPTPSAGKPETHSFGGFVIILGVALAAAGIVAILVRPRQLMIGRLATTD